MSDKLQSLSNCSDKVKSTFGPSIKMRCLRVRNGSLLPLTLGANQSEREQATLPNLETFNLEQQLPYRTNRTL